MAQEGEEPFELDEPATHTHTPPAWPIQTLIIEPSGKAPKQHGPHTYRFGSPLTLSVLLPRRGWTMVKKTKNYIYLIPPAETPNPPFQISIAVPPDEECLAIANRSFARGKSWFAQLGEWPAWYFHERNMNIRKFSRDPATGDMVREIIEEPPQSSLTMGELGRLGPGCDLHRGSVRPRSPAAGFRGSAHPAGATPAATASAAPVGGRADIRRADVL